MGFISPAATRPVIPTGYRPVIEPGAATIRRTTWPSASRRACWRRANLSIAAWVAGMQPGIWLGHGVRPLQMSPPGRGVCGVFRGGHFTAIDLAGLLSDSWHRVGSCRAASCWGLSVVSSGGNGRVVDVRWRSGEGAAGAPVVALRTSWRDQGKGDAGLPGRLGTAAGVVEGGCWADVEGVRR